LILEIKVLKTWDIDLINIGPHSDAPLQNIHENSKLTTNKAHTSSAKRLDVLEGHLKVVINPLINIEQQQDGNKVPHYFKDQYQNSRKTSTAKGIISTFFRPNS